MEHFDLICAGGGAAGLSLAYHAVNGGLESSRILIIDLDTKTKNDRTWCFWSNRNEPFDAIVAQRWSHIWFHGPDRSHRFALNPYEYRMIRGIDFYNFTRADLTERENVRFVQARVTDVRDGDPDQGVPAVVTIDTGEQFAATWVFDSLFLPRDFTVDTTRYHFLKQHFVGWFVECDVDVFDADAATMFDLRVPSYGEFRFMYVLPQSGRAALVEYTLFSARLLEREEYEREIRAYLERHYPGVAFRVTETEDGIIPMTEQPFPRRTGRSIMTIGTKGGRVKASTGFAFHRTQRDSERIVRSLRENGHPFHDEGPPRRYQTYDAMLLSILDRDGDLGRHIFVDLFEKNPLERIWRFLDEDGALGENILLMNSVPWWPFIAAWFRVTGRNLAARLPNGTRGNR